MSFTTWEWIWTGILWAMTILQMILVWRNIKIRKEMIGLHAAYSAARAEYLNRLALFGPILSQMPPGSTIIKAELVKVENAPDAAQAPSGERLH